MANTPQDILNNFQLPTEQATQDAFTQAANAPLPQPTQVNREPAVQSMPTEDVNMVNPEGKIVGVSSGQMQDALKSGYKIATEDQVAEHKKQEKYGTTGQAAIAGLEAAGRSATFGLSTAAEEALGVKPEDILAREDVNPGTATLGAITGLVGSSFIPGVGAANILERAGAAGAKALGVAASETAAGRIGSAAVKGFIENAMVASGDQVSRMIAKDPDQSASTAAINVGLSGLLGGGVGGTLGAAGSLWKAAGETKTAGFLKALAKKTQGIEGVIPDNVEQALTAAGVEASPAVKAGLSDDPYVKTAFQKLQESNTPSGIRAQSDLKAFREDISKAVGNAFGKSPEDVAKLEHLSTYEAGESVKKNLVETIDTLIEPISKRFNAIREKYSGTELPSEIKGSMATKIAEMAEKEGYNLSPSGPQAKLIGNTIEELQGLKTLNDLRKYQSIIGDNTYGNLDLRRVGGQLKSILRDAEDNILTAAASSKAGADEALAEIAGSRAAYRKAMEVIDTLNDDLRVGKYNGPQSFTQALKELGPEDVMRRLSSKNNAGIIQLMSANFPEAANLLKQHEVDKVLKVAAEKATDGHILNVNKLLKTVEGMSPETRNFLFSPETLEKLKASQTLIDSIPGRMNTSGTAKTLDSLMEHVPASAAGMAAMLTGHNPVMGAILGYGAKTLGRDIPDAMRLAALKFLGSDTAINAPAFKGMVDYIHAVMQGETMANKAVKNLFKAGKQVLPSSAIPTEGDRTKLNKKLQEIQRNPSSLLENDNDSAHYLPDHAIAMSATAASAANYLNSLRPNTTKQSPLDSKVVLNNQQKQAFNNALNIAQQPLVVLDKVKNGTITPQDIQTLQAVYPKVYSDLKQKMFNEIVDLEAKGEPIPYKTRMGASLFMGTPLDSTMKPESIIAAQPKDNMPQQQAPAQGSVKPPSASSMKGITKLPTAYQTQDQARAVRGQRNR